MMVVHLNYLKFDTAMTKDALLLSILSKQFNLNQKTRKFILSSFFVCEFSSWLPSISTLFPNQQYIYVNLSILIWQPLSIYNNNITIIPHHLYRLLWTRYKSLFIAFFQMLLFLNLLDFFHDITDTTCIEKKYVNLYLYILDLHYWGNLRYTF